MTRSEYQEMMVHCERNFARIDGSVEALHRRIDAIDRRIDTAMVELDLVHRRFNGVESRLDALRKGLNAIPTPAGTMEGPGPDCSRADRANRERSDALFEEIERIARGEFTGRKDWRRDIPKLVHRPGRTFLVYKGGGSSPENPDG